MRLLTAALLAFAALPSLAAGAIQEDTVTWYDVELIVFRNLDTRSTETWPPDAGTPDIEQARLLYQDAGSGNGGTQYGAASASALNAPEDNRAPTPFVPLDESAWQLGDIFDSLLNSSKYEPVLHIAWTQPPLDRAQSPYLRVTLPGTVAEEREAEDEPLLGDANDEPLAERDRTPEEAPEFLQEEPQGPQLARPLDGTVQLSVSRYLHLDLDLIYLPDDINANVLDAPAATREWTEEETREREQRHRAILDALARGDITLEEAEILALEPDENAFQGFRLNQYRRLRSGEIHYFDHPVYGAIVKVTPREVSARTLETPVPGRVR